MRDKIDPATSLVAAKLGRKIEGELHKAPLIIFRRNLTPTNCAILRAAPIARDRSHATYPGHFCRHARSGRAAAGRACATELHLRALPEAPRNSRDRPAASAHAVLASRKSKTDRRAFATRVSKVTKPSNRFASSDRCGGRTGKRAARRGGSRGLHECRKIDAVQRLESRRSARVVKNVRDTRSHRARGRCHRTGACYFPTR